MKQLATTVAMCTTVTVFRTVPALADSDADERRQAADNANNPLPPKTQLHVKPSYTFPNGSSRYTAELLFEPLLRYDGFLIPDLRVAGFSSVARVQISAESLENAEGPASGLADLTFVDVVARAFGPIHAGLGYGAVFPMATSPSLGQGKLQLGPAATVRIEPASWLKIAALTQVIWSVAGSCQSPDLAYVSVQPFITVHLPEAMIIESNAPMKFYWRGTGSTLPVNLGFGHAFSSRFVGEVQGWYTLADEGQNDIKLLLFLNFQSAD